MKNSNTKVTYHQMDFNPQWLGSNGLMVNALPLLAKANELDVVFLGHQLIHDPHPFINDDTMAAVKDAIGHIHDHTVNSQWNHAFTFRIGQGEIWQELIHQITLQRGDQRIRKQVNAIARIRPHMATIYAVDRSWQRIDSDTAELARYWPYTKFAEETDPTLPPTAWINSFAFDRYCPDYVSRWCEHVQVSCDQLLWNIYENDGTRAYLAETSFYELKRRLENYIALKKRQALPVTEEQRQLLWRFYAQTRETTLKRQTMIPVAAEGGDKVEAYLLGTFTTVKQLEDIVPAYVQLLKEVLFSIGRLPIKDPANPTID